MRILVPGEILWDVFPDGEHLGGAPFNFAVNLRRLGHEVRFVSAVGADQRGTEALARAAALGLPTRWIHTVAEATGTVSVQLEDGGQPHFTLHRPAAYDRLRLTPDDLRALAAFDPDWICFGTLLFVYPEARRILLDLIAACPRARRFYDVNLRPQAWSRELVEELLALAHVVKANQREGEEFHLEDRGSIEVLCVTLAERGSVVHSGGTVIAAPGYPVAVADAVGAGDAFAAAFLHGLGQGWPAGRIADFANRVGAIVASRPGGTPHWTVAECMALQREIE